MAKVTPFSTGYPPLLPTTTTTNELRNFNICKKRQRKKEKGLIAGRKRRHAAAVESTFAEPSQCKLNGLKGKSEVSIVKKGVLINKKRQNEARRQKKKNKREKNGEKKEHGTYEEETKNLGGVK